MAGLVRSTPGAHFMVRARPYENVALLEEMPGMSKLNLSVAIGDYDRNRPLIDGAVQIDGVDPVFMTLSPEEIFFRALRTQDFDICECRCRASR